jgi:hypothetical protein
VLATLIFILWAYGMYALISALSGRKGSGFRGRNPRKRYGWLALVAGVGVGLGLAVFLANSFDQENHNLKLSGFLGTVWAEGWPDKVDQRVEFPPIKGTPAGNKPVYALLHPGAAPAEVTKGKTPPKPRPLHKPKLRRSPAHKAKGVKVQAKGAKKEKAVARSKSKTAKRKKKRSTAAAARKNPNG